jgi:hypothetical protein
MKIYVVVVVEVFKKKEKKAPFTPYPFFQWY